MALSEKKIQELKKDWIANKIPVTEIARKHDVSRSSILKFAEKYKWKGRKKRQPKPKESPKKGRPTKYNDEYLRQVQELAMIGFSDERIAKFLGTNRESFRQWKKKHPEFLGALQKGRTLATQKVVVSLFERAIGYSHPDSKVMQSEGRPIIVPIRKYYPPDYKCIAFWLKNKEPELWKDKQEIAVEDRTIRKTIPDFSRAESPEDFEKMTSEEFGR
jgi:transposase-like protein